MELYLYSTIYLHNVDSDNTLFCFNLQFVYEKWTDIQKGDLPPSNTSQKR